MAGSMIGIHKIAVDTTNLAEGSSIAAYLVDAAGALLTSTLIGAKQRLDVNTIAEHLQGTAYAAGVDYLNSIGVVNNAGNWVPFTLNAAGELPVAATVNFAGDYAEDSAHVSADVGLFSLSVRRDTRSSGTSADGDYASFNTNAVGELWVKDADALAQLVLANSSLDAIEASAAAIEADADAIRIEQLAQGVTLDAIDASADAIEADVDAIRIELLDQGVTLDSILADTATIDSQTLSIQNTLTALSKAEDAPHASGDQGIQALLVRQDVLAASTSTDGDYGSFKSNNLGELYVKDTSVLAQLVTLSGFYYAEDSVHVSGDMGIQSLAVRRDTQGSNVSASGDYASHQQWSEGSLKVVDVANGSLLQQQVSVTSTAGALPAAALANRKTLMLQNTGGAKIWIGSATVTSSGATAGIEVPAGSFMELEVGPAVAVFGIKSGAGSVTCNILEAA